MFGVRHKDNGTEAHFYPIAGPTQTIDGSAGQIIKVEFRTISSIQGFQGIPSPEVPTTFVDEASDGLWCYQVWPAGMDAKFSVELKRASRAMDSSRAGTVFSPRLRKSFYQLQSAESDKLIVHSVHVHSPRPRFAFRGWPEQRLVEFDDAAFCRSFARRRSRCATSPCDCRAAYADSIFRLQPDTGDARCSSQYELRLAPRSRPAGCLDVQSHDARYTLQLRTLPTGAASWVSDAVRSPWTTSPRAPNAVSESSPPSEHAWPGQSGTSIRLWYFIRIASARVSDAGCLCSTG